MHSLSSSLRSRFRRWYQFFIIVLAWACFSICISVYDYLTLLSLNSAGLSGHFSFLEYVFFNLGVGVSAAFAGGGFLVFIVHDKFRESPYWKSIVLIGLSFLVVSGSLVVITSYVLAYVQTRELWNSDVVKFYLQDFGHLKNLLIWFLILILTQIALQVNDKFGPGTLFYLILGKYNRPREENRIFMFVDLISSTSIAEKLGNEQYHLFLREFYADITNSILDCQGEIYQYVGDEVVISWPVLNGPMNTNCLNCYFEMRNTISSLSEKYKSKFNAVPDFKAGIHCGKVIVGEIGIIKREITFSGDVLNTTSRIQGKCHEYNVKILASNTLLSILSEMRSYQSIPLGDIELRGKENRVAISTLNVLV